jgi:hypothetical protein
MADDRLDRGAPFHLAANRAGDAAHLAGVAVQGTF